MSNFAIIRVGKVKAGSIASVERHNLRENINYRNVDIHKELKSENVVLFDCETSATEFVSKRVDELAKNENVTKSGKLRKLRADAPRALEYVVTASREALDKMPRETQLNFFRDALEMLEKKHGKHNIVHAVVHYDEVLENGNREPHLHVLVVPENKKHQLRAKEFMSLRALSSIQDEIARVGAVYGLVRGQSTQDLRAVGLDAPRHRSQYEWKAEQAKKATEETQDVKDAAIKITIPEKKFLEKTEHYEERIKSENASVVAKAEKSIILEKECVRLQKENTDLKEKNRRLLSAVGATVALAQSQKRVIDEQKKRLTQLESALKLVSDACARSIDFAKELGAAVRQRLMTLAPAKMCRALWLAHQNEQARRADAQVTLDACEEMQGQDFDALIRERFGDNLPPELAKRLEKLNSIQDSEDQNYFQTSKEQTESQSRSKRR